MNNSSMTHARHRADTRPTTPWSALNGSAGRVARRGTAIVAGAAVALTLGLAGASASEPARDIARSGGGAVVKPINNPGKSSNAVVNIARQYVGTPYVWGGSTPRGFDCSGFTQYVYAKAGIKLPRTSSAQGKVGTRVSASNARPGDLIWWPGHVGIYTGNGNHIAARQPGVKLHESKIYRANPTFIRVTG